MAPPHRLRVAAGAAAVAVAVAMVVVLVAGVGMAGLAAATGVPTPLLRGGRAGVVSWVPIEEFTDEWATFNHSKWHDNSTTWSGRAPSAFDPANVHTREGRLDLVSRYDPTYAFPCNPPNTENQTAAYGNWTTAMVESRHMVRYGFFEVRSKPGNGVISSAFWLSWNTDTDWTELDVYELGGNATGGPGPGFPYILFMNTHVFRRTGTDITPDTVLSEPCHYVARIPLISRYNVYALDWNAWTISWLFNGRVVRVTENVYHQQDLVLKLDSETMPTWFGLPSGDWRNQTYSVLYLRAWSRTARHVRNDGDGDGTTCHVRTITESRVAPARGHARISKYALQRAPSPGSKQVAGLAEPVPVKGWGAFLGRGPIGRGERFFPPTRVGAA